MVLEQMGKIRNEYEWKWKWNIVCNVDCIEFIRDTINNCLSVQKIPMQFSHSITEIENLAKFIEFEKYIRHIYLWWFRIQFILDRLLHRRVSLARTVKKSFATHVEWIRNETYNWLVFLGRFCDLSISWLKLTMNSICQFVTWHFVLGFERTYFHMRWMPILKFPFPTRISIHERRWTIAIATIQFELNKKRATRICALQNVSA